MWLSLHANGTRPAPWDTKLGAWRSVEAIPLRTLRSDGGAAARVLVYVVGGGGGSCTTVGTLTVLNSPVKLIELKLTLFPRR